MSEFSDVQSLSRLIGLMPGLVGSENPGLLKKILVHPGLYQVFFDEVEKAHPVVLNALFDKDPRGNYGIKPEIALGDGTRFSFAPGSVFIRDEAVNPDPDLTYSTKPGWKLAIATKASRKTFLHRREFNSGHALL